MGRESREKRRRLGVVVASIHARTSRAGVFKIQRGIDFYFSIDRALETLASWTLQGHIHSHSSTLLLPPTDSTSATT